VNAFARATRHLAKDPVLRRVIKRHGPCALVPRNLSPYESLVRAIAHQQLHGKAAESILARFVALNGGVRYPTPSEVLALRPAAMRRCGFSAAKVKAIRDIARHAKKGVVPTKRACMTLSDEALIERLTAIWGVGRWTVEMLLIFTLGREDVLPVDDFGVREGFRRAYGMKKQPTPKALREFGTRWAPYRSVAAWYFWRVAGEPKKRAT
jgi:DNA-3-methyladenine glycosylase II